MTGNKDIKWITVNGNHIPLEKGQTAEEAIKNRFSKEQGKTQEKASGDLVENAGRKRFVAVMNNSQSKSENKPLTKQEDAELGAYKVPKEPVIRRAEDASKWELYDRDYSNYKMRELRITANMVAISKQLKMPLIGLEHALKSKESYDRKVRDKRLSGGYKPIGDAVRYTFQHSMTNAVEEIRSALDKLKEMGYNIKEVDNKWKDSGPYKGINVDIESSDGVPVEVQFLTENNHKIKDEMHTFYEIARDSKTPQRIKDLATRKMYQYATIWQIPDNIREV